MGKRQGMCGPGQECCSDPWGPGSTDNQQVRQSPHRSRVPPSPGSAGVHLLPQRPVPQEGFSATGQPKPTCTRGCAPSYRGSWYQHLQQLVATLGMCQMMLLLPGMIYSQKELPSSTETPAATEFHRTKRLHQNTVMFPCAFLSFLHSERKRIGPASAIQHSTCSVSSCGSSRANTTGCLLSMAMEGHKTGRSPVNIKADTWGSAEDRDNSGRRGCSVSLMMVPAP